MTLIQTIIPSDKHILVEPITDVTDGFQVSDNKDKRPDHGKVIFLTAGGGLEIVPGDIVYFDRYRAIDVWVDGVQFLFVEKEYVAGFIRSNPANGR